MEDFIRRSDVLALLPNNDLVGPKPSILRKQVEEIPAVDAEEIVRCKDCKYGDDIGLGMVACNIGDEFPWDLSYNLNNHFCGYGERRTDYV